MSLQDDSKVAKDRNLRIEVTKKLARSQRWETVYTDVGDLEQAITLAKGLEVYESGVFVFFSNTGGFIYWTSRFPEVLNSGVVNRSISENEDR